MAKINEKEITLSSLKDIENEVFEGIIIYPRRKKHKDSKCQCMLLKLWNTDEERRRKYYYVMGEETDVLKLKKIDCSIDIVDGCVHLYSRYSNIDNFNRIHGFRITHIGETIYIE